MKNKGTKTTLSAIIGLILALLVFTFWLLGKIDNVGLGVGLGSIGTIVPFVGLIFAKDASASHTFDAKSDTVNPNPPPPKDPPKNK